MKQIQSPNLLDKIGLVALATIWSFSFISMRYLSEFINPSEVAFWRLLFGTIVLGTIIKIMGVKYHIEYKDIKNAIVYGVFGVALPFILLPYASHTLSAGIMTLIMSIAPFFAVLVAHFLTNDDKITGYKLIGIVIGFIGVAIAIWDGIINGVADLFGGILVALSALIYALSANILRLASHMHALVFLFYSLIAGTIFLLIILFANTSFSGFDSYNQGFVWWHLIYLGFLPTAIAWWYRFNLTNKVGYGFFSMVGYVIPITGIILGYLILDEQITPYIFISLGLIILSLWVFSKK